MSAAIKALAGGGLIVNPTKEKGADVRSVGPNIKTTSNSNSTAKTVGHLVQIGEVNTFKLTTVKTEPRVDSRLLARGFGNKSRAVIALIDKYLDKFKTFGQVRFQKADGDRKQGGGMAERYALLNENQAYLLLSLTRNSEVVVDLKVRLIRAFDEARRAAELRRTEYLPTYRAAHDMIKHLANGSRNAHFQHMNFNKLLNRVAGIEAGTRATASVPQQSILIVGQMLAAAAMQTAKDGKEAYRLACNATQPLANAVLLGAPREAR